VTRDTQVIFNTQSDASGWYGGDAFEIWNEDSFNRMYPGNSWKDENDIFVSYDTDGNNFPDPADMNDGWRWMYWTNEYDEWYIQPVIEGVCCMEDDCRDWDDWIYEAHCVSQGGQFAPGQECSNDPSPCGGVL